jgi:hypothetical protein
MVLELYGKKLKAARASSTFVTGGDLSKNEPVDIWLRGSMSGPLAAALRCSPSLGYVQTRAAKRSNI